MTIKSFVPGQTAYILDGIRREGDSSATLAKIVKVGRKYVTTDGLWEAKFKETSDSSMAPRGPQAPQEPSKKSGQENTRSSLEKLLSALSEGKCKGIKGATVYKLTEFASEMGLL